MYVFRIETRTLDDFLSLIFTFYCKLVKFRSGAVVQNQLRQLWIGTNIETRTLAYRDLDTCVFKPGQNRIENRTDDSEISLRIIGLRAVFGH